MPSRSPKEWTPQRIQKILKSFESRTVDTSKDYIDESRVIGAASVLPDNRLVSAHVTDDPAVMIHVLESGIDLQSMRPWGDLCGGLYVSSFPQIWKSRSRKKWEFMETLPPNASKRLAPAVLRKLDADHENGRLSQREYERARRDVEHYWVDLGNWQVLLNISSLPYAINVQQLAKDEGIANPFEPSVVEVVFEGRYLNSTGEVWKDSRPLAAKFMDMEEDMVTQQEICQTWRTLGWDGAFTKAAMGTNPELVIWNADRILKFGDWERPQ